MEPRLSVRVGSHKAVVAVGAQDSTIFDRVVIREKHEETLAADYACDLVSPAIATHFPAAFGLEQMQNSPFI